MEETEELRDYVEWVGAALELSTRPRDSDPSELVRRIVEVQERIEQRVDAPSALLRAAIALTVTELHVLWVLAAIALDPATRRRVSERDAAGQMDPALETLRQVVHGKHPTRRSFDELGPHGPVRRLGLIERADAGADVHESRQSWAISRRILALLHGDNALDAALAAFAEVPARVTSVDELAISGPALGEARQAMKAMRAVVIASGMPGLGRRTLLVAAAAEAGIDVLQIDARRLAQDDATLRRQLRAVARECKLLGRVPLLANLDALVDEKGQRIDALTTELVALTEGLVLVTCGTQRPQPQWDRPVILIELGQPTSLQRSRLWGQMVGDAAALDPDLLANQYPLAPALIFHATESARVRAAGREMRQDDVAAGVRSVLDDRLGLYARRVAVSQTWDDLVLPAEQADSVVELIARIRERRRVHEDWGFGAKVGKGLGVSALFSGPPGTGKTMVAALIARDLGLELYQVDLGKVVSKWIGETEKNLGALFDAAEAGYAVVLFDEADSLFGKRTDVKSSNDRYANLETNYLLQRLESFTGICLLTSNYEAQIDPAFQRRLSLHVRFELPDAAERTKLWRAMLPAGAPVAANLDLAGLARRYEISGGYIRNATLRAAFLAANDGTEITARHLDRAARLECEGLGRIV